MRLNQVTVPMTDYEASVDFYRRLGLVQIVAAPPHYARFECLAEDGAEPATFSVELVPEWAGGDWPLAYFELEDLDAAIVRLRENGVAVSDAVDQSWLWREAETRDPAGNRVKLYQPGRNRRFPPWRIAGAGGVAPELQNLETQAAWCAALGSPFMEQLLLRAAEDFRAGGIVRRLLEGASSDPLQDALALRFAGALHAAVLGGRDEALATAYPGADADWRIDRIWPLAVRFLERETEWVQTFMESPPQTNETGRSGCLAAAFMHLAIDAPQPFCMLELGASAGLNLWWDRFRYQHPPWNRGEGDGPLIPTVITGAPPAWRDIAIASREACDQSPIDPMDALDQFRLRAYVWPDQPQRMERLNAALRVASLSPVRVEKVDAASWVAERLALGLPEGTTVVYHSIFLQYPPKETQAAIAQAIHEAGERARPGRQLAWVRFEPERVLLEGVDSQRNVLNIVRWDGASRTETTLAEANPHGLTMTWL